MKKCFGSLMLCIILLLSPCLTWANENRCCEKLMIRLTQNVTKAKYKDRTFSVLAADIHKQDEGFLNYINDIANTIAVRTGARYNNTMNRDPELKVYVYYDSIGLPFVIDKKGESTYVNKSCLYSTDARLAKHRLFIDILDSKSGRLIFESRSTAESAMNFDSVVSCMISASIYDMQRSHKNRMSMCNSCE